MKVAIPSTPADAKGLLAAAIRDPDPVVVLEPKLHYRTAKEEVPEGEHVVPLGKARVAREGSDLTIVAYGAMVHVARACGGSARGRGLVRGARPAHAEAARRGRTARVGRQDRARRRRAGGATRLRVRAPRWRPSSRRRRSSTCAARSCASRGTTSRIRTGRSRTRTCPRSSGSSDAARRVLRRVTLHEIPLERRTLHGHFSRDLEPILTVESGDSIAFSCLNAGWRDAPSTSSSAEREGELDAGHALVGPVEVRGARAGQTLEVAIEEVRIGAWRRHAGRRLEHAAQRAARRRRTARLSRSTVDARRRRRRRPRPSPGGGRAAPVPRRDRDAAGRAGDPPDGSAASLRRATSTARSSSQGRRSSCRSRSTVRSSPRATGTRPRGTARSRSSRSRRPSSERC